MSFLDSASHVVQLLVALCSALVLFLLAFMGYARSLFLGIIVMIPFQPIVSKYGTINMAVTYVVGFAILLNSIHNRSGIRSGMPLVAPFSLIFIAYFMSWSMAPELFSRKYALHLISISSNVVLFYMSYSFFKTERDLDIFFKALIVSNVFVIIYSTIQVIVGYGQFSLLGIDELNILSNRKDQRLVGPYLAVGITAEYLVIQSLMLAHYIVQSGKLRRVGLVLLLCNLAILVGTGNRGGFISALLAVILFLYHYRRYLGNAGVLRVGLIFATMLTAASIFMTKYTDFNVLYSRLLGTEMEGVVPDTRRGWVNVIDKIEDQPLVGHGPRIVRMEEYDSPPRNWPVGHINYHPHNLYLYILYTTGLVGFFAYTYWAVSYWRILCRERRRKRDYTNLGKGLSTLGMVVFIIFLFDQLKVEFLRYYLLDYQHYLAALFGMFVAHKNIATEENAGEDLNGITRRQVRK
jgi:O-antigen ligase